MCWFQRKVIQLSGEDSFGYPLEGIIHEKCGGSEDRDSVESVKRHDRELIGWADAILGVVEFPNTPGNDFTVVKIHHKKHVAEFLEMILLNTSSITSEKEEERKEAEQVENFKNKYLTILIEGNYLINKSVSTIKRRLTDLFGEKKKLTNVTANPSVRTDLTLKYTTSDEGTNLAFYFKKREDEN